jgi:hypothetical protein
MRCISCGAEMRLLQVDRDDSMMVPGYERQTLQCSGCNEVEHRTVFSGENSSRPAEPSLVPSTPVASILSEADKDLDESEAMLRRAIEMVRGPARSAAGGGQRAGLAGSMRTKGSVPSRVVRIRHDAHHEAAYAAADAQSGLVVLRHQDSARLRAMCDRLGWQVVDADVPSRKD